MFFDKFLKASKKVFSTEKKSSSTVGHKEIKKSPDENLQDILKSTGNPDDLFIHRIADGNKTYAVVMYLEPLVDSNLLGQNVIEPVKKFFREKTGTITAEQVELLLSASKLIKINDLHIAIDRLLSGYALILVHNANTIFAVSLPGFPRRAIKEAITEKQIKGPREGFTETISDNISLIRRYIRDPNLRLEKK